MTDSTFTPSPVGAKQWEELQGLKPEDVCRRASVSVDEQGGYVIPFVDREYRVYADEKRIEGPERDELASDSEFQLLLLIYLISAQNIPFSGKRMSERDIPGGDLFFKGPHTLPVAPLIEHFGKDPETFLEIGTALGGSRIAFGDVAIEFLALPRVPIACVLWAEDEEFPARVSFLFDSSVESHLPLDVVLALVRSVVKLFLDAKEMN